MSAPGRLVDRVGANGDGMAGDLAIPFTLPGERVLSRPPVRRGRALVASAEAILSPSPDRVAPPCPHFGACGGCALQHWAAPPYAAWKLARVADALRRAGFADPNPAWRPIPPGTRRRIDLGARRDPDGVRLGLHVRGGDALVDMQTCLVLDPALLALLPPLRALLRRLGALRRRADLLLSRLDTGPDLLLRTDFPLDAAGRTLLARFARAHAIPRIAWAQRDDSPEIAAQTGPVSLSLSNGLVAPPPGAFLQASRDGEAAILNAVLAGLPTRLPPRARIVELHAGIGSFTFALAQRARVLAVEGDPAAVAALRAAASGKRIETLRRDLSRQPLQPAELSGVAALVLDPPWDGAGAQMGPLAAASIPRVIYVSCNPAALARDAALLARAGYRLLTATAIDQFPWAAEVESVSVFSKEGVLS